MADDTYPGVPRRIFLRAAADILDCRAQRLRRLADPDRRERRGTGAKLARDAKAGGRTQMADHLVEQSRRLWAMAESTGGPDMDAAVAGYALAWIAGHDPAMAECIAELADLGVTVERPHGQMIDYAGWVRDMMAAIERMP